MKILIAALILLGLVGCNATQPQKNGRPFIPLDDEERASILEVQSAGKEMYEKDIRAAKASDLVLSKIDPADYPNFVGWVTYRNDTDYTVSFYEETSNEEFNVVADVAYKSKHQTPNVSIEPIRDASETEVSMIKARIVALNSGLNSCAEKFNTVILEGNNPDQWEVYVLAATTTPSLVQVGGHTRVAVSKLSGEVVKKESLSKSCLALSKAPSDLPEGHTISMLTMSHIISDYPVEIHPYLNLLHGIGFAVMTERGIWIIEDGAISLMDTSKS